MVSTEKNSADQEILSESRRHTRRSFAVGAAAAAGAYGLYRWIASSPEIGRQELPLRRTFESNAALSRALFGERGLAPTYPVSRSSPLRLNGNIGMQQDLVLDSYRLQLVGAADAARHPRYSSDVTTWNYRYENSKAEATDDHDVKSAPKAATKRPPGADPATGAPVNQKSDQAGTGKPQTDVPASSGGSPSIADRFDAMNRAITHRRSRGDAEAGPSASGLLDGTPGLLLTMADIRQLPHHELVTEFKCIEGWSQIVQWGGVRLVDLLDAYPPEKIGGANGREPRYVYMETPDGNYYGGYDLSACRHPQSLLVTEMAGVPLSPEHGAPLRLHMPIKYGYKQLKRIGLISYMDTRPDDYWTKLGYDWYAGL